MLILGCTNPAKAGPFGGCAAVQMGSGAAANAAGTNTTAAAGKRSIGLGAMKGRAVFSGANDDADTDDE